MNLNIFKRAFSLTELLIVLVIVAILFAASAPIISKRFSGAGSNIESVWRFTDGNQHDAYFDSEVPGWTSAAYIGLTPKAISNSEKSNYLSKVILKATKNQEMIHFRYGAGDGIYAGSFIFDDKGNIKAVSLSEKADVGENNTAAGVGSLGNYNNPEENVAIGARAIASSSTAKFSSYNNVAVGVNSGEYLTSNHNNTFVGANTGRSELKGAINNTVAVGSNVLNAPKSAGNNNVFAGANVASAGLETASHNNVILSSTYYATNSQNNTIIGYNVYTGKTTKQTNLTAVGANSCSSVSDYSDGTTNTCIGYSSAKNEGTVTGQTPLNGGTKGFDNDDGDHIYLGGSPKGFGGRSVLEVHNFSTNYGPTVVLNSNLVVRGNVFHPNSEGLLSSRDFGLPLTGINNKKGVTIHDTCCKHWYQRRRRKKWHDSECKSFWDTLADIGIALIGAILVGASLAVAVSLGGAGALAVAAAALYGMAWGAGATITIFDLFSGNNKFKGAASPVSASSIEFADTCVKVNSGGGIDSNYPTTKYCPNLKLSDLRLKENISENYDAIEKILLVMPYNYSYIADKNNTPQVGVIAQDLQMYLPNSVSIDDKGFLQIRRDELFYVTINSIKSLNSKLTNIVSDVETLEKDSDTVKSNQRSVQKRIDALNKRVNKLEK